MYIDKTPQDKLWHSYQSYALAILSYRVLLGAPLVLSITVNVHKYNYCSVACLMILEYFKMYTDHC